MKKIIIYLILCALTLGLFSCGTDEPEAKTIEGELCGTWKSVGTCQIYDACGDAINNEITFGDMAYLIMEIRPSVIYITQYIYDKIEKDYVSDRYALLNWYYFDGYIRGTYVEYDGGSWVNTNTDIDFWKIKVGSKDEIKLCTKVIDFNDRVLYTEFPFTKISNDYSY